LRRGARGAAGGSRGRTAATLADWLLIRHGVKYSDGAARNGRKFWPECS
jgi:hypothetical protein